MGSNSSRRGSVVLLLVLALVAGGLAAWQYDLVERIDERWFSEPVAAPPAPAEVPPPPGLEAPDVPRPAVLVAPGESEPAELDVAQADAVLSQGLAAKELGPHVLAAVAPLNGTGPTTFGRLRGTAIPASTTKVMTSAAALLALGPDTVFRTSVVGRGRDVVLVGGGDPYLGRSPKDDKYPLNADVVTLAEQTAEALRAQGRRSVRVGYDDGLFTGPEFNPTWKADYAYDDVSPIGALWVDQGVSPTDVRVQEPALDATQAFAAALGRAGINVRGEIARRPAGNRPELAGADSPPVEQIVERVLDVSDNEAAEVLFRHIGRVIADDASFAGGQRAVRRVLRQAGIELRDSVLYDGSGLSRANRLSPEVLIETLRLAAGSGRPELRALLTGLPVAGFTGSLIARMGDGSRVGLGRVRAKTGSLNSVQALAGMVIDATGTPLVFVLMADRFPIENTWVVMRAFDDTATALAGCVCS